MEVTVIWTGFANLRLGPEYGIVQILDANTATANLRCGGTCIENLNNTVLGTETQVGKACPDDRDHQ